MYDAWPKLVYLDVDADMGAYSLTYSYRVIKKATHLPE